MQRYLLSIILIAALLAPTGQVRHDSPAQAANKPISLQADPPVKPRYTITDLGTLGGAVSKAYGINDKGQVVGSSYFSGGEYAFLWEEGTMQNLGSLGGNSWAYDINNAGQVVGKSYTANSKQRAFLWANGTMQDLGTLGGSVSYAYGINDSGQVVGQAVVNDDAEIVQAFLWQNGSMQILGAFLGGQSTAYGINNDAKVVGDYSDNLNQNNYAFLWQNGAYQDLGLAYGKANAINNKGQVVGESTEAFLWQDDAIQYLGTLGVGPRSIAYDINDAGQVVGMSYIQAQGTASHAFLWEKNQLKDLNNLIPAGSGWELREAHGINKKGQIVGYGVINGQSHAYMLTPNLPVLIVPGIAGTYSSSTIYDNSWLMNRGVHPTNLQIDPLARVYHDLIQTFKNLGYVEGKDLFIVNYDWRLSPGPTDGQFDGLISGLDAETLADEQFNYAVDYLGYYLRQAVEAYRATYNGVLPGVNLISHSTGGLVARTYIQSSAYEGVYDSLNDYSLPAIDHFVMVGVPNRGASKAWNPIHDNWIADTAYRVVLSKIINRAYQKVLSGGVITGPDYNINLASITVNNAPNPQVFIEKYVPTVRSLLATYDFIDFGSGFVNLNGDPAQRNNQVLDLNNGLDLAPTSDPNPFADLTTTTAICGASEYTANLVVERTGSSAQNVLLPFTDFILTDAGVSDIWYEDLWLANGGDKTVPLESCYEQFISDGRVVTKKFFGGQVDHTGLMANPSVQSYILDQLNIEYQSQNIATGSGIIIRNVISVILDPVDGYLVDNLGRRLGYTQAAGAITEIPGSMWFGDSNGFGWIVGSVAAPLHLELTGLGQDHYVMVSVEHFGKPAGGAVSSGYLAQGELLSIPVEINTRFVFIPLVSRLR